MKPYLVALTFLLGFSFVRAGEIVIIQPSGKENRNERNADRSAEMARQYQKRSEQPILIEDGTRDAGSGAQRASREAQDYLRNAPAAAGEEQTVIILRSAPPPEAEKSRQKAASYIQPNNTVNKNRNCSDVSLSVGTIGDKPVSDRNVTVNDRGNTTVNVNCRK